MWKKARDVPLIHQMLFSCWMMRLWGSPNRTVLLSLQLLCLPLWKRKYRIKKDTTAVSLALTSFKAEADVKTIRVSWYNLIPGKTQNHY